MKYDLILNPDKDKFSKVAKAVKDNGGYCPCLIEKSEDTKCPCRDKRENNICHCGLYVDPYDKEWNESNFREFPEFDLFESVIDYKTNIGFTITSSLEFTSKMNNTYKCFLCNDELVNGLCVKLSLIKDSDNKIAYSVYIDLHCYLEFLNLNTIDALALKVKNLLIESEVLGNE